MAPGKAEKAAAGRWKEGSLFDGPCRRWQGGAMAEPIRPGRVKKNPSRLWAEWSTVRLSKRSGAVHRYGAIHRCYCMVLRKNQFLPALLVVNDVMDNKS